MRSQTDSHNDATPQAVTVTKRKRKLSNGSTAPTQRSPTPSERVSSGEESTPRPVKRKRTEKADREGKQAKDRAEEKKSTKAKKKTVTAEEPEPVVDEVDSQAQTGPELADAVVVAAEKPPSPVSKSKPKSKSKSQSKKQKDKPQPVAEPSEDEDATEASSQLLDESKSQPASAALSTPKPNRAESSQKKDKLTGFFRADEVQALENYKVDFCNINGLPADTFDRMVQHSHRDKGSDFPVDTSVITKIDFWKNIYDILPNRDRRSVYRFMRRHFQASSQKPHHWTEAQDDELAFLAKRYAPRWAEISKMLGRSQDDVVQRWKNRVEHRDKMRRGPWSEEEARQLLEALTITRDSLVSNGRDDIGKDIYEMEDGYIGWGVVSNYMNNVRSRQQCADKWRKIKRLILSQRKKGEPDAVYDPARETKLQERAKASSKTPDGTPAEKQGSWKNKPKSARYVNSDSDEDEDGGDYGDAIPETPDDTGKEKKDASLEARQKTVSKSKEQSPVTEANGAGFGESTSESESASEPESESDVDTHRSASLEKQTSTAQKRKKSPSPSDDEEDSEKMSMDEDPPAPTKKVSESAQKPPAKRRKQSPSISEKDSEASSRDEDSNEESDSESSAQPKKAATKSSTGTRHKSLSRKANESTSEEGDSTDQSSNEESDSDSAASEAESEPRQPAAKASIKDQPKQSRQQPSQKLKKSQYIDDEVDETEVTGQSTDESSEESDGEGDSNSAEDDMISESPETSETSSPKTQAKTKPLQEQSQKQKNSASKYIEDEVAETEESSMEESSDEDTDAASESDDDYESNQVKKGSQIKSESDVSESESESRSDSNSEAESESESASESEPEPEPEPAPQKKKKKQHILNRRSAAAIAKVSSRSILSSSPDIKSESE